MSVYNTIVELPEPPTMEQLPVRPGDDAVAAALGALEIPYDLLEELNRLADNAAIANAAVRPSEEEVQRWMNLFSYTRDDAEMLIWMHLSDIMRVRISDQHWFLIHQDCHRAGHSRESWEHLWVIPNVLSA